jgi:hypothetical protein
VFSDRDVYRKLTGALQCCPINFHLMGKGMTGSSNVMERRMVVRLLHYWRDLISPKYRFPTLASVNPQTIAETWDWCYILETGPGTADPSFRFIGSGFADELIGPPDRQTVSKLGPYSLLFNACRMFELTCEKAVPVSYGGEFVNPADQPIIFRTIILPLCDDDGGFSYLMGATNYRVAA